MEKGDGMPTGRTWRKGEMNAGYYSGHAYGEHNELSPQKQISAWPSGSEELSNIYKQYFLAFLEIPYISEA